MLERLKKRFYWKNFVGKEDVFDDNGLFQRSVPKYSDAFEARANISSNKGTAEAETFGALLEYDRLIVSEDVTIDMNENSIVWLDGVQPPAPYNYIVVRKSVSNNYVVFALKRVEVS